MSVSKLIDMWLTRRFDGLMIILTVAFEPLFSLRNRGIKNSKTIQKYQDFEPALPNNDQPVFGIF